MQGIDRLTPDSLIERRKLRRSRSLWRVLTVILFAIVALGVTAQFTGLMDRLAGRGEHIARVEISGFIDLDESFLTLLEDLEDDDDVKAVIVRINSPGGLSVAGETVFTALSSLRQAKPLVAVVDGIGTSAAYLAASASEHIVARNNSIVGSIGVVAQFPDVSGLLETVGVTVYEVRSGELKAQPSAFSTPSDEALAELESLIADNFNWFVDQIEARRGLDGAVIRGFEGAVFTGSRGLEVGLVDEVGGESEALDYLSQTHDIDRETDVLDRAPARPLVIANSTALARLELGQTTQLSVSADELRDGFRDAMLLDGLLWLWHGR